MLRCHSNSSVYLFTKNTNKMVHYKIFTICSALYFRRTFPLPDVAARLPGVARFRILWSEILSIVDLRRPWQFQEPGLRRNHYFCFLILNTNFRSCETLLVILCDVEKKNLKLKCGRVSIRLVITIIKTTLVLTIGA